MVELVVVLVLIGILAVFAVPRFINLNTSGRQAATNGIAASLTVVSSTNFAARTANSASGSSVTNCTSVGPLLSGGLPAGYTITSAAVSNGARVTCTLTGPSSSTANFVALGIT